LRVLVAAALCLPGTGVHAQMQARSAPAAADSVSAFQVYMACRHPRMGPNGQTGDNTLRTFCRRRSGPRLDSIPAWIAGIPGRDTVRAYAEAAVKFERDAQRALQRSRTVESPDVAAYPLVFVDTVAARDSLPDRVRALASRLATEIDSGRAVGVVVRIHPGQPKSPHLDAGARSIAGWMGERIPNVRVVTRTEADAIRYPLREWGNRVGVHLEYAPSVTPTVTALGRLRFAEGRANLTPENMRVLTDAAREILAANLPVGTPILIRGFADANRPDSPENRQLAQERADTIRMGLVQILRDHNIQPQQIVAEGGVLTGAEHTASAERRANARSAEISLGAPSAVSALQPAAAGQARPFSLSAEAIASTAADVLMDRAQAEIQAVAFRFAADRVCADYRFLVERSCALLNVSGQQTTLVGLANLREVVHRDAQDLPERLLVHAARERFADEWVRASNVRMSEERLRGLRDSLFSHPQVVLGRYPLSEAHQRRIGGALQAATSTAFALDFVRRVRGGQDIEAAVQQYGSWLASPQVLGSLGTWLKVDTARLVQLTSFIGDATRAAEAIRREGGAALQPDTVALYTIRTWLINAPDQRREGLVRNMSYLVAARSRLDSLRSDLDEIRVAIDALGKDGGERRRELFAQALGEAASRYFAIQGEGGADRVQALSASVRDLYLSLEQRDVRGAFAGAVTLAYAVIPEDGCDGCPRIGLSPATLRAAALVSDISAARDEAEVRAAMQRFMEQGSSVADKRDGPRGRVYVNAYAGLGARGTGDADDPDLHSAGIQLPIGLELTRPFQAVPAVSLYARAIELSGFLPGDEQTGDRDTEEVFADLVRPGLFVLVSPFGSGMLRPVTVGAGVGTRARRSVVDEQERWNWETRFNAFIGWDLPLFP
jgi:outer membrane protein OmpA-like peptidoglycan-associated protein